MINIPKTIKVAGVNYSVKETDELIADNDLLGRVLYHKSEITLDSSMSDDKKEQVFMHELLHAIFKEAGYDEQDEDMVNRLGIVLHQVLKDNKLSFKSDLE